jgi:hypothetical protein
MLQPINTKYKNYNFRSRLEARYAIFFDELKIKWLYEHEGYELGNGERYLPDFYLPDFKLFIEIKPVKFNWKEHSKCKRLSNASKCKVVQLVGLPSQELVEVIIPYEQIVDNKKIDCIIVEEAYLTLCKDCYDILEYGCQIPYSEQIEKAVIKATEARFEFSNKNKYQYGKVNL